MVVHKHCHYKVEKVCAHSTVSTNEPVSIIMKEGGGGEGGGGGGREEGKKEGSGKVLGSSLLKWNKSHTWSHEREGKRKSVR